jgi:hypothetical protein
MPIGEPPPFDALRTNRRAEIGLVQLNFQVTDHFFGRSTELMVLLPVPDWWMLESVVDAVELELQAATVTASAASTHAENRALAGFRRVPASVTRRVASDSGVATSGLRDSIGSIGAA